MWIQGYYPVYRIARLSPANLPWSRLTHLAYFNLAPSSTGGLENTVNGDLLDEMENVVDTAHANDVKVVVTIGGASAASDATWRAAVNSTNRATLLPPSRTTFPTTISTVWILTGSRLTPRATGRISRSLSPLCAPPSRQKVHHYVHRHSAGMEAHAVQHHPGRH